MVTRHTKNAIVAMLLVYNVSYSSYTLVLQAQNVWLWLPVHRESYFFLLPRYFSSMILRRLRLTTRKILEEYFYRTFRMAIFCSVFVIVYSWKYLTCEFVVRYCFYFVKNDSFKIGINNTFINSKPCRTGIGEIFLKTRPHKMCNFGFFVGISYVGEFPITFSLVYV